MSSACLALAQADPAAPQVAPAKSDAQISFGRLKNPAGAWSGTVTTDPQNPDIDGPIQVTMRVA
jgi:hypothetical protein